MERILRRMKRIKGVCFSEWDEKDERCVSPGVG
jgi:hypothetical protein